MANKFDDLLEQFGSNAETLNETVLVDKKYLEEQKRKAKAYDQIKVIHDKHIYDFLNMSETECIEKIGDILEDK